jgi:hypothetical protein
MTHIGHNRFGMKKIATSHIVITVIIVSLLLCSLMVTNGQESVYSLIQRGSPEGVRDVEQPGNRLGGILAGPYPSAAAPAPRPGIGPGEIRENVGPFGPVGPVGPDPSPGIGQEEIRENVGPAGPLLPNATKHVIVPLPPKYFDNNIVIGNKIMKSESSETVENIRYPVITTSQSPAQEVVIAPPPPVYESPPAAISQANGSSSTINANTMEGTNTQSEYSLPVANPGSSLTVRPSQLVELDGSKSYDPNGDPLYFLWLQLTGGPTVSLLNSTTPNPSFVAPAVTNTSTLTFELLVGDGQAGSMPSYTYVTVEP